MCQPVSSLINMQIPNVTVSHRQCLCVNTIVSIPIFIHVSPHAEKKCWRNASWKRWSLSFLLKESLALVVLIFAGRLSQSLGAATDKGQFPQVEVKDLETTRKFFVAEFERKERVGKYVSSKSFGYHSGSQPSMILKVINRILNFILCSTGSQCNFSSDGVLWPRMFHSKWTYLVTEFCRC